MIEKTSAYDGHGLGGVHFLFGQHDEVGDVGQHVDAGYHGQRDPNSAWKVPARQVFSKLAY